MITSPSYRRLLPVLGLAVLAVLVFHVGLSGGLIFDDEPNLVRDTSWRITSLSADQLVQVASGGIAGLGGRPLAMFSFGLNHVTTGESIYALKLTNLSFHILNTWLVYALVVRFFRIALPDTRRSSYVPLFVAAAWTIHPLQASTVLYVVQRMELGAATGILLSLLAYVSARERQIAGRPANLRFIVCILAMLFGLGFKESALLAPVFILLIELVLLRFAGPGAGRSRALIAVAWGTAIAGVVGYLWIAWPFLTQMQAISSRDFTPYERVLTQGRVLIMYLGQIVIPLPDTLRFYYDDIRPSTSLISPLSTLVCWLVIAMSAWIAWCLRRRAPLVALGIGWFFAAHALTSNVIPLELAFEHRNYLALIGPLLVCADIARRLGGHFNADARRTLAGASVAGLAALSYVQAATWGNPFELDLALENRAPQSQRASYALGQRLLQTSSDPASPTWHLARRQFERAAALPGSSPLPLQAMIIMDAQAGIDVSPDTWNRMRALLTERPIGPAQTSALYAITQCTIERRCAPHAQSLLDLFAAVLEKNPSDVAVHAMYANFAWNVLRDRNLAIAVQRMAVDLRNDDPQLELSLIEMEFANGERSPDLLERAAALAQRHRHRYSPSERERLFAIEAALRQGKGAQ
ncbi:hypothetical protein V3391_16575 [Luteimonas sp. SMYT11W]|uniref:Tetratricopeptide repeat protein n=1 Tax=Luteimonas flava TaxID=3115822 RepID=A0ABU7WIN0_9GAMM